MTGMRTRRLGRTGWEVTELGLGCFQFTGDFRVPREEADRILDLAFGSGINFFDTAAMYGRGESEELLAHALARHGKNDTFVATKVGHLGGTVAAYLGDDAYQDADALTRAIKHSLWTLRLDTIDVLMVHEPDWPQWGFDLRTGDSVVTDILETLKREGAIRAIGLGGWDCDGIAALIETARFDVALIAGAITLLAQPIRDRVLPAARQHDVGVIVGGALGQGGLSVGGLVNKDRAAARAMIDTPRRPSDPDNGQKLLTLYQLSDQCGLSLPELAIRYVLSFDGVSTHIAGARELTHLQSNLQAIAAGPLPADLISQIEAIGVGKEATVGDDGR